MSKRRYESSDLPASGIAKILAGLYVLLLASGLAVALMLGVFAGERPARRQPFAVLEPPPPRLEADPRGDRIRIDAAARARLNSYGWTDRGRGLVHIPVERAMTMVAARGWGEPEPPPSAIETAQEHRDAAP